jgi:hypothetical protein
MQYPVAGKTRIEKQTVISCLIAAARNHLLPSSVKIPIRLNIKIISWFSFCPFQDQRKKINEILIFFAIYGFLL